MSPVVVRDFLRLTAGCMQWPGRDGAFVTGVLFAAVGYLVLKAPCHRRYHPWLRAVVPAGRRE